MFTETRVREITVSKAEAVEVIIRNLHVFADSEWCAGNDFEQAFRDGVRAIEKRDVAALSTVINSGGDAEDLLFPDGVDLAGVTLDDDWIFENFGMQSLTNLTTSVTDRCLLLQAGFEIPSTRNDLIDSQIFEAALDAGFVVTEKPLWRAFGESCDHAKRAIFLLNPRMHLSDADLLFEYVRARDQKAALHLLTRDLAPVNDPQACDKTAFEQLHEQLKQTYAFILDHGGLAYEYILRHEDLLTEFNADDGDYDGNQALPADQIYRSEIERRIQAGSTTPFIPLGTTDPDIAKMIADVNFAKSLTSAAIKHGPGQRKRNRGNANSL